MTTEVLDFIHYCQVEKGLSKNTIQSYQRDLEHYRKFMQLRGKESWTDTERADIVDFLYAQKEAGRSTATLARFLSSVRAFHQFLLREQVVKKDPAELIEIPK